MPGPAPKQHRRRSNPPARGEWQTAPGIGWQHGPIPDAPDGLLPASVEAWRVWFGAWFAAHWSPDDLPGLRVMIALFDQVERGGARAAVRAQLHAWMQTYGVTPKGQQDRRWQPPEQVERPTAGAPTSPYAHLKILEEDR